jgi:hypothetical protein
MRSNTVFLIGALLALAFGIGFILMPAAVLSIYGITTDAPLALMARYFGLTLLQVAVTLFVLKETRDAATQRGLALGGAIGAVIGLVVSAMGAMAGTLNAMGWSVVAIYAILLLGYLGVLRAPLSSPGASSAS